MTMTVSGPRRGPGRRWILGPSVVCVAATLLFLVPIRVFGLALPEPVFPLVAAFGWAALRPSMIAPAALLALGLFLDLTWGGPLGLWPLCLLAAHAFALSARRLLSGEEFGVLWAWYGAACALALGVGLLLTRVIAGVWPTLIGVALQWLVSAALFPLAWRLIERYQVDEARLR